MTSIASVNAKNLPVLSKDVVSKQLGQEDFLRLMTSQLKQQDPFNPMDNQAMVAQMAQFSSVAGISEMNASLQSIATKLDNQTRLLANIEALAKPSVSGN
jgi:flagellar basal-body rod modification protein FlgD